MSGLESFRDSRSAEARGSPLPLAEAAAPAAVAVGRLVNDAAPLQSVRQPTSGGCAPAAGGGAGQGQDVVFPLVHALYAQQQRCRRQRQEELARVSKKATAAAAVAACVSCGGGSGLVAGGGGGGGDYYDDDDDGGFSAKGVAAAAADGAAAVCGDWEGEAKTLVRELRDACRSFPSEVGPPNSSITLPRICRAGLPPQFLTLHVWGTAPAVQCYSW